jgi:perosamine synthetase
MAPRPIDLLVDYKTFDPSGCGFPKPQVPVLPGTGRFAVRWRRQEAGYALARAANARFYSRGRYALTEALRLCGVGPTSTLMAPAYHCRTMLDPAIRLGSNVVLYPVTDALAPDLEGLRNCLATCEKPPAALLLTHFFGFEQPLDAVLALCAAQGIALIEDCSHCLFLPHGHPGPGLRGRYAVASPYKFFPAEDGGTLWANHGAVLPTTAPVAPAMLQEFKGLLRMLQRATAPVPNLSAVGTVALPVLVGLDAATGVDRRSHQVGTSEQYQPALEEIRGLAISRWAICHTETQRLVARRRAHYMMWANAVAGLPHCRALLPELQPVNTPYMFPLYLDHPDTHFAPLKRLGMPVWRWDDMALSSCATALDYRTHLLHLPCHQELTDEQMGWMMKTLGQVLSATICP